MSENNTFINAFVRGGRLRKNGRRIVSFAPFIACASAVALGAVMIMGMPAEAGDCPGSNGVFHCSGEAGADETRSLTAAAGESLTVTSVANFGIHVSSGSAIVVANVTGSTSIDVKLRGNGDIQSTGVGIEANHRGTGDALFDIDQDMMTGDDGFRIETAATSGALTVKVRGVNATESTTILEADGVDVMHEGSGNLVVESGREISADARGIRASHQGGGGSVSVTADGKITSGSESTAAGNNKHAIVVDTGANTTTATITANRELVAKRGGDGISVTHEGSGNVEVTAMRSIMATGGIGNTFGDGVDVANTGGGNLMITAGEITADARGIRASHLGTGGSVTVIAQGAIASGSQSSIGDNRHAITVTTGASVTTATIETTGNLTANKGGDGITLTHAGSGNVRVTATGTITATGSDGNFLGRGIFVNQTGTDALIETYIKADGQITSHSRGIGVSHSGGGKLTVMAAGVTSNNAEGIHVGTGTDADSVEITASGAIMSGKDGISVNHQGTGDVTITADNDITTIDTSANCSSTPANCERGIDVATAASGGALTVEVMGGTSGDPNTINTHDEGIMMRPEGSGPVELAIRENANILSENGAGVYVYTGTAAASVTINMEGEIGSSASTNNSNGMSVTNRGSGILDVDITGDVRGAQGLILSSGGDADIDINSLVKAESGQGIVVTNDATDGADRFVIRLGSDAMVEAATVAMSLRNDKPGSETVVYLAGAVTGGTGAAINFEGVSDRRLVIGTEVEYAITGAVNAGTGSFDAVIELTGVGTDSFNLDDDFGKFTDFKILEKTGSGTWTLANSQGRAKTFDRIDVSEGKLVSEGLTELIGTSLNIAEGAVFEVVQQGTSLFNTAVTLGGTIELANVDTTLSIPQHAVTGRGGSVVIPVDFSAMNFEDGEHNLSAARFSAGSVEGDSIVINIRATGELPEEVEESVRIGNLVSVETANPNAFTGGVVLGGRLNFTLETTDGGQWSVVIARGGQGSIEQALYESLPAALTQLASLQSYQQRLQGRRHDGGFWAKVSSASAEFEPVATSLATYEIRDSFAEFGVDVPLRAEHVGNFTLGASVAFGDATTEVAVPDSTGEIDTGSFKAAISANWEHGGPYVDGQLQYAVFNNDVKADAKLGSANATAYSGSLEAGYGMGLGNLRVLPSVRLLWASADFEDFTDPAGMEVVLDDGVVVTGRAGIGVEYDWNGALFESISSADVLLRGRAGVLVPVDGDVNTRIDGMEFVSEREEPAFDVGLGATYLWDGYALSADVSTRQGGEVEGYTGSVGLKYEF